MLTIDQVTSRLIFGVVLLAVSAGMSSSLCAYEDQGISYVVETSGGVSLLRQQWDHFQPISSLTPVSQGDLIRLGLAARAKVVCPNLTVVSLTPGISNSFPCTSSGKPLLFYEGSVIAPTRGVSTLLQPLLLSPRKTAVLPSNISFRWTPIAGARQYEVSVLTTSLIWKAIVTNQTYLKYPASAPSLHPGQSYHASVLVAGSDPSSDELDPDLTFTILSAPETVTLHARENLINHLSLSDPSKQFLLASTLAISGLKADAIDLLQNSSATNSSPGAARLLGALYEEQSLFRMAEQWYLKYVDLAKRQNDIEGQAWGAVRLREVYRSLGNVSEAQREEDIAEEHYHTLGPNVKPNWMFKRY
jgi:hypothetical protein